MTQHRLLLKATVFSLVLNLGLVLSAIVPSLARVADIVAAPPGIIIKLLISPPAHSPSAFIVAAAESLACSIVFYLLIAWVVLKVAQVIKRQRHSSPH